jgi:hypothetical protein
MTEEQVRGFCLNNGVNATPIGTPLRVLDPTELPASVRKFVNEDGTYRGDNTPESEDANHEESKGEPDADETAVRKSLGDTFEQVEQKEAEIDGAKLKGKLPDDFPGHAALETAGITTYAQLRKAGNLDDIVGIGPATAQKIRESLGE